MSDDTRTRPIFQEVNDHAAVTLFGGQRALLLQLAHPLVAAGVRDHSGFLADPLGRLVRTLDFMHALLFGTPGERHEATAWFRAVHAPVRGRLKEDAPPFHASTPYTASSPALLLWVWATLAETAPFVYERAVRPLTPAEKRLFHRDSKEWALRLGVPPDMIPATWGGLHAYVRETLDRLTVSRSARALSRQVLFPPGVPRLIALPLAHVTVELLPPRLREGFGLTRSPLQTATARALLGATRALSPVVPKRLTSIRTWTGPLRRLGFRPRSHTGAGAGGRTGGGQKRRAAG